MEQKILAFVLAGGKGERLMPLTQKRAKPAVPFGGSYRIIDFALSNLLNSGIERVVVPIQFKPRSLDEHIEGWKRNISGRDRFIKVAFPYEKEGGLYPYSGTAGAVEDNLREMEDDVSLVNILAGDHIYLMDFRQKNEFHLQKGSEFTISAVPVPVSLAANRYGVLVVNRENRVIGFEEKPENPSQIPGMPGYCWASAGIYSADAKVLRYFLESDATKEAPVNEEGKPDKEKITSDPERYTSHDFGNDIIPALLREGRPVFVYNLKDNNIPYTERFSKEVKDMPDEQRGFWLDVGSIDQFFKANMELVAINPRINIYNPAWPVYSASGIIMPSKNVEHQILFGNGTIRRNGFLERCIVGDGSSVEGSELKDVILLGDNFIEDRCTIHRAIIDKEVHVPERTKIGIDKEQDISRGFEIKDGITIVPKGYEFQR